MTDESKIELLGRNKQRHIWRKPNTAFDKKDLVPTVKHGGGSIMVWGYFAASELGKLEIVDRVMNSVKYWQILDRILKQSAKDRKLARSWMTLKDNYPTHVSNSSKECFARKKIQVLEWPRQSVDLNPIKMLTQYLTVAVHQRKPSNLAEMKQFCTEEWTKISPSRFHKLGDTSKNRLQAVLVAKGQAAKY